MIYDDFIANYLLTAKKSLLEIISIANFLIAVNSLLIEHKLIF